MLAGELIAGGGADSEVIGLAVYPDGLGCFVATWAFDGPADSQELLAVTLDGDLVAVLPAQSVQFGMTGLADGEHRIDVHPICGDALRIPDLHGADYGKRAYILWPASTDPTAASYAVYRDGDLEEILGGSTIHPVEHEAPQSGTGTGRVSIRGDWSGANPINQAFAVRVAAGTTFQHNLSGSWSTPQPFVASGLYDLDFGVTVQFHGLPATYDAGDQWDFRVGPPTAWDSGELPEGTHVFTVAARDAAGNESDPLTAVSVVIVHRPGPVTAMAATWDGEDIFLSWALPAELDLSAVLVFANYGNAFERLGETVIEDSPWLTLAPNAEGYSFTPPASGTWRFQIRTKDADGRVSDLAEIVEVETGVPTGIALNVPDAIEATPIAGGAILLSWQYEWSGGEDAVEFRVYVHEDENAPDFTTPAAIVEALRSERPVDAFDWDSPAYVGARWFTVRASDGTVETANVDLTEGVPDAAPPTFSGDTMGVPN